MSYQPDCICDPGGRNERCTAHPSAQSKAVALEMMEGWVELSMNQLPAMVEIMSKIQVLEVEVLDLEVQRLRLETELDDVRHNHQSLQKDLLDAKEDAAQLLHDQALERKAYLEPGG